MKKLTEEQKKWIDDLQRLYKSDLGTFRNMAETTTRDDIGLDQIFKHLLPDFNKRGLKIGRGHSHVKILGEGFVICIEVLGSTDRSGYRVIPMETPEYRGHIRGKPFGSMRELIFNLGCIIDETQKSIKSYNTWP